MPYRNKSRVQCTLTTRTRVGITTCPGRRRLYDELRHGRTGEGSCLYRVYSVLDPTQVSDAGGEMKRSVIIFSSIGMEARSVVVRAFWAVVWQLCASGRLKEAPSFRYKKGNKHR